MEKQKKHTPTHLLKLHLSRPRSTWMLVVTEVKGEVKVGLQGLEEL